METAAAHQIPGDYR